MKTFLLMVAMLSFTGGLIWPSRPRCTLRSPRLSSGDLQVFIVRINSFPRLLVHSLTPSLHKLFTHSLLTLNLLTQSINHSLTQLITHLLTHLLTHQGLTVVELKERLKQHGLAVSGVKSVLISRLQEHQHAVIDEKTITNAVTGKNPVVQKSNQVATNNIIIDELEALMHEGELILNKKNYNSASRYSFTNSDILSLTYPLPW